MIRLVLLCCLSGLVYSALEPPYNIEDAEKYFEEFIETHNKHYKNVDEKAKRLEIFKKNLKGIIEKNNKYNNDGFGINQFTDLTNEEFKSAYLCSNMSVASDSPCQSAMLNITEFTAPDKFDWRSKNKVTKVKDQKNCGSCWAFGVVGNLESQYAMKYNELSEFSEQQLLDCSTENSGCSGGFPDKAMDYVIHAGGIMSESDYPYTAAQGKCQFARNKSKAAALACTMYRFQTEDQLKETLYKIGPITVGVAADSWQSYKKGILSDCVSFWIDHAVLLVGWGVDNGTAYWLIKNSWGEAWGEQGYIRIKRNVNACMLMHPLNQLVSATIA